MIRLRSKDFKTDISRNFGDEVFRVPNKSFVNINEAEFFRMIDMISYRPKLLIETGTASGCSALLLSQYAERIITFDVVEAPVRRDIWKFYGVDDRITSHVIKKTSEIPGLIPEEFDFAFIDGDHTYAGCALDIAVLEKCRRILFHDVSHPPIMRAINELIRRKDGVYLQSGVMFGY